MRRRSRRLMRPWAQAVRTLAVLLVLPTLALLAFLALEPARRPLVVHVYLLVVGGLALATFAVAAHRAAPAEASAFAAALESGPPPDERVPEPERLERALELAQASAFDVHYRLRPLLREIASQLLASRRGIDLDAHAAAAREALGPDAWEIVRADRPRPSDRGARGASLAQLEGVVEALERL